MKLFTRCIIIVAIIATVAVSYRHANGLWYSWYAEINDDGTGCIWDSISNIDGTAYATAYVNKWTGSDYRISYTQVSQYAGIYTTELSSNNEQNTGVYFLNTGKTGPKDGDYEGEESDYLYCSPKGYFLSPKDAGGYASALVDPDDDNDAGPARADFSDFY